MFDGANLKLQFQPLSGAARPREVRLAGSEADAGRFEFWGASPEQSFFFAIDARGWIHVWNMETGGLLRAMKGPAPPVRNAVLSPRGTQLALSTEREDVARLYDCASGKETLLAGHHDFVSGLAFSPDASTLASGSMDGTIRLWSVASGKAIASLAGHMQETTDVAFSPDGRTLASLGQGESLKLWHPHTLRELVSENVPRAGYWLVFSPDGRKLAVETDARTLRLLAAPAD
jgi:WD40 repeat protein